ncbi:hypothetical protein OAP45_01740 [Candidatus Pelagibacter sp.]|nr:hypothetical protein [Candidatus Pelagibacter sp.]
MSNCKSNIILHIGLYKTGSTFIQSHLHSAKLDDYNIFLRGSEIEKLLGEYLSNPNTKIKQKILNIIQNENSKKILISSEGIFGHQFYHFKDCSIRFQLLEELFNQPMYIIFFREPSSIIYSGFFQGLQKSYSLKFENYINENKNDLFNKNFFNHFTKGLDYKIYNYNNIFKDYLNIQNRVLFVEYEKFFKEKNADVFNKFTGLNISFNFEKKENQSLKNLIYCEFYSKFFFFKYIKIIWLQLNKLFFKYKKARDVSLRLIVLINFLIKITPKKYIKEIDDKHKRLLEEIKSYHSDDYREFKKKLNSTLHISSN